MTPGVLVWLATSIACLILASYGVGTSLRDIDALEGVPRNGRYLVARHQLVRYVLRVATMILFIVAALAIDLAVPLLVVGNVMILVTTASDLATGAFLRRQARQQLEEAGK